MTVSINFRPEAVEEIDATFQWYEEQRRGLGEEFFSALLSQLDRIRDYPEGWAVLYRRIRACPMQRFPYVITIVSYQTRSMLLPFNTGTGIPAPGGDGYS
jgi:hypothetical protein